MRPVDLQLIALQSAELTPVDEHDSEMLAPGG